jgi:penicillin-binding protein 1C
MAPAAAHGVLRILEGTEPPPGVVRHAQLRRRAPVALKTGTSYGFRDAWAFAVTGRYVVGVWVGRPDGTPSPERTGRNAAAPFLFRVLDLLPEDDDAPDSGAAAGTATGGDEAAARTLDPAPPAPLQRRLDAGPPGLSALSGEPDRVRLVFPTDGMAVELTGPDGAPAPLTLSASGGRRPLAWLVDGRRLPAAPSGRDAQWQPEGPGFARVSVVDALGHSDSALIEVR